MADLPEHYIMGMDNPLLDITAEVPPSFIEKYELKLNNAILAEEKHIPIFKEMIENFEVGYTAGGATQNAVRTAQWMIGKPRVASIIGCVGNDEFQRKLEEIAQADGVNTVYLHDQTTPTGSCAVLVHEKERSLVANLSAANNYKFEHLKSEAVWNTVVESSKIFYIAGYFLTVSPESMVAVGNHAAETGKQFLFNISAPFLCQVPLFFDRMKTVLPLADYVFGNESEAQAFAEASKLETKSIHEIAKYISELPSATNKKGGRTAVITQGAEATVIAHDGEVFEFPVELVPSEKIVDLNGAGDSFVGGFLSRLALGESTAQAVHAGHFAASQIIQRSGCTFPPGPCAYQPISSEEAQARLVHNH